jgi:hypothetical protein
MVDEPRRSLSAIALVVGLAAACQADDDHSPPSSSSTDVSNPGTPRRPWASGLVAPTDTDSDPGTSAGTDSARGMPTDTDSDPGTSAGTDSARGMPTDTDSDPGTSAGTDSARGMPTGTDSDPGTSVCLPGGVDCSLGAACCFGGCGRSGGGSCSLDRPGVGPVAVCCW